MKLIDKDALVAEIERRIKDIEMLSRPNNYDNAALQLYKGLLSSIDTLETKEEILDEEGKTKLMKKCVHRAYKRGYDMGVLKTINEMNHNIKEVDLEKEYDRYYEQERYIQTSKLAKHFFELGLKAQKGE